MTRASILAIGTELTQGQITNRNAVWISEHLVDLGIDVVAHLTVPDDRALMRDALDSCARGSELLIVTGGLGPTTDDFTREVLSAWTGAPLEFRDESWAKIVRRLTERGIEVAQSNRIQCDFPRGATVLENLEGTADGFRFLHSGVDGHATEVLVLPGPPREGQYLWKRFVDAWLRETFPAASRVDLERWHCLGKSESSLGEIVEAAVAGFGVTTGYRASVPYVEVKLWIPASLPRERRLELLARTNAALAPYSVARNDEDLATRFAETLLGFPGSDRITVLDLGSAGRLTERVIAMLRTESAKPLRARLEILTRVPAPDSPTVSAEEFPETSNEVFCILFPSGEVAVVAPSGKTVRTLPNPYPSPALADRLGGFRAEMALKAFSEILAFGSDAL